MTGRKKLQHVQIEHTIFSFDGGNYYHEVADFTGTRATLVYYSCLPEDVPGLLIKKARQPPGTKASQFQY